MNMHIKIAVAVLATILVVGSCYDVDGLLFEVDTNDKNIQRMANDAVSQMGAEYKLVEVTHAEIQVDSGGVTHLEVTVNKSEMDGSSQKYICMVQVVSEEWKGSRQHIIYVCEKAE